MTQGISIESMAAAGAKPADLARLFNETFTVHEGVVPATPETMAWYLRRPGLGPEHVFVALDGEAVVGAAMVTAAPVVLGGSALPCGIVDSVMTRPACRGRGIATALMRHTLDWMREAGLAASLLYTGDGSDGYRIYARLGYQVRGAVCYYAARPAPIGQPEPGLRALLAGEEPLAVELLNRWLGEEDGFVPIDPPLWQWRRHDRPRGFPCTVFLLEENGHPIATGTLCATRVTLAGRPAEMVALTDVAGAHPEARERIVRGLLRRVPPGSQFGILTASEDRVLPDLAERLGMHRGEEVVMALPLSDAGAAALARPLQGGYTLAESLLGL